MSFQFLLGDGHLPAKAAKIARDHDAQLINHVDPGCSCGYGCPPQRDCPRNKRHWFTAQNLGEPSNQRKADGIAAALSAAKIKF